MNEKIRILFSIETNDRWIFEAYRSFYDLLNKSGTCEIFCTVSDIKLSDNLMKKYNVVDYVKLSERKFTLPVPHLYGVSPKELTKQAESLSLWANPRKLLERYFKFLGAFHFIQPDIVIVWNGMADIRRMIASFLKKNNKPFFYAEKGMLPESWYIDESGINAESSLNSSILEHKLSQIEFEETETYIKSFIESGSSAWEQPERIKEKDKLKESLKIGSDSRVIFFPGQVDEDVNITRFSQFNNIAEAVKLVLEGLPENCCLVVKPHPKSKEDSKERLSKFSLSCQHLKIVKNINVWDIIEICDLVVSINSTVAFEALLRNKRVLLLGDGVLSKTGLCKKVNHFELGKEIEKCFEAEFQNSADYIKTLSFVNFLRKVYYIFRNTNELPASVLSRIEKRAKNVSDKMYNRQEIIKMLYKKEIDNKKPVCNMKNAVDCFLQAKKEFERDNFSQAVQYIKKYQSLIDYSKLPRKINSDKDDIEISVIIVTYRRTLDLKYCLETLTNQDSDNYEIIVVDNGGTDYEVISRYVDQYIRCPVNFNLSEGRNIGVYFALGRIVAFLDDDALVEPGYISSIKSAFDKYDIFGLRGRTYPKNTTNNIVGTNIYDLGNRPFPTYCNQEGNSAWDRDIYTSMGGMDPLLFGHEGSDLTYRILNKYQVPDKVIYWPDTIIYHDYPTEEKSAAKKILHQRSADYLKYKHNANIFADRYDIEEFPIPQKHQESKPDENISADITQPRSGPKVSIIISCHNSQQYLSSSIESIQNQTVTDWELFLLDDASSDNTKEIIEKYSQIDKRIKPFYFSDNKGPYVRRNFGIERANSDFIIIQDADDIMHPQKIEKLYHEITRDERLGVVGSFYLMVLDEFRHMKYADKIELPVTHQQIMQNYNSQLYICWHGSAIIRKSLFNTIGLYDEHPYGSDKFWLAKVAELARYTDTLKFKNIPEYLTYKIEHTSSQQGQLPTLDPRSRRAKFQTYWLYKLMKIREKVSTNPDTDILAELKNCKCNDYIEKYGHLFEQWEMEKLDEDRICIYIKRAVDRFNEKNFVSCVITLDSIEKISRDVAKKMRHYNLLRAMAYYAIDRKERSFEYLNLEIKTHNSPAATQFLKDGFDKQHIDNIYTWCSKNAGKLDLRINNTPTLDTGEPLVSVIIPAYNAQMYISGAIQSVLIQDYKNFELIIINDGSTDNTGQIVSTFNDNRIRYFNQNNQGLAATHNTGIKYSRGRYIIKLDADDMMTPDFISEHIREFKNHPQADLIYCDDCLVDESGRQMRIIERPEYTERKTLIRDTFRNGFPVVPFRTCIKKSVFERIGLFDEKLLIGEDYDMMRRFISHNLNAHRLKKPLYLRRMTNDSLSRNFSPDKAECLFEILEKFTSTFSYDELFPDVDWEKIIPQKKALYAKCLTAETYIEIGKSYLRSKTSHVYADVAFRKARQEYEKCLEMEPDNYSIRQIVEQYNLHKLKLSENDMQTVT